MTDIISQQKDSSDLRNQLDSSETVKNKADQLRALELENLVRTYHQSYEFVNRLINDETREILEYFESKTENKFDSVFDCTLYGATSAYVAIVSLQPEDVARSVQILKECCEYCDARRKKLTLGTSIAQALKIKTINYNSFTEQEAQAEICYAGILALRGLMHFFKDSNFLSLISASLKMKSAMQSFRVSKKLMKYRTGENEELNRVFYQSTKFGVGVINLILANVPKRLLQILQMIGFSGNEDKGMKALLDGCGDFNSPSVGGLLCFCTLAILYLFARSMLGNGSTEEEIQIIEPHVASYVERYPDSSAVALMKGRLENLQGNIDKAMEWLLKSIQKETRIISVQLVAYWELGVCYTIKEDYRSAAMMMRKIREESHFSKCAFSFLEGILLLSCPDKTEKEHMRAIELIHVTPDLVVTFAGKRVPFEKYCARKARQYFIQDNYLFLPSYDFIYMTNHFELGKYIPGKLESIIEKVDNTFKELEHRKDWQFYPDNYCLGLLLKGMCFKYLKQTQKAHQCFQEVIDMENDIFCDEYLPLCAHLEAGLLDKDNGKLDSALAHFKIAKKIKLFWMEFRVHRATDSVKRMKKEQKNSMS